MQPTQKVKIDIHHHIRFLSHMQAFRWKMENGRHSCRPCKIL